MLTLVYICSALLPVETVVDSSCGRFTNKGERNLIHTARVLNILNKINKISRAETIHATVEVYL